MIQTTTYTSLEYPVAGRSSAWLFAILTLVLLAISHFALTPELFPRWARIAILTSICTVITVAILMFGRESSLEVFVRKTAALSAWTLTIFAAVVYSNPICLYIALVPLLIDIVAGCKLNRGTSSLTFIVLLSLWISTGVLLTILLHGPFEDLALVGHLSSIAWYLDLRLLLTAVLFLFILCRSLLIAIKAPTRRLIQEVRMQLQLPIEGGLVRTIVRAVLDATNDLLLRHLSNLVNLLTGMVSVVLCYISATGREIGYTIRNEMFNKPVFGVVFRRVAIFCVLLLIALVIPPLAESTLLYIRSDGFFSYVLSPIAVIAISLLLIAAVQLLKPVDMDQFIQGAGRAAFFIVCVFFGVKTVAFALSFFPKLGFLYAHNIGALYLLMLISIVLAALAGLRRSEDNSPNKSKTGTSTALSRKNSSRVTD